MITDIQKLTEIFDEYGSPTYVFDTDEFKRRAELVKAYFGEKTDICYSIKANPFLIKALPPCFSRLEVCSPGELTICEKANIDMKKVIFSGVNKTYEDIAAAIRDGVGLFTAESRLHMELINRCAGDQNKKVPVILRLSSGSQFGMDEADICDILENRQSFSNCDITGLHFFSGTQKKKSRIIEKELEYLEEFIEKLKDRYSYIPRHVEYGAGLSCEYFGDDPQETDLKLLEETSVFIKRFSSKYPLTVEMGRFFAATSGIYLTRVMDTKTVKGINYAVLDGGIHHLKYDGQIMGMQLPPIKVLKNQSRESLFWTLCGSLCTTSDVLVKKAELPDLKTGDAIAFFRVGAYSVTEGISLLLSRPLPKVICRSAKGGVTLCRDLIDTSFLNTP